MDMDHQSWIIAVTTRISSGLVEPNPLCDRWRSIGRHSIKESRCVVINKKQFASVGAHESFLSHVIKKRDERFPVLGHVEQGDGFRVYAQVAPRPCFEEFFERANATGHGDEAVGEFGQHRFAFVHGVDDMQLCEFAVRGFALHECVWHDANDFATSAKRSVGQCTHEANSAAAKYHRLIALGNECAE